MPAATPASVMEASGLPVTLASSASVTEGSSFGFSGVEVTNRRLKEVTQTPIAGVWKVGSMAKPMGLGFVVPSDLRHQGAT